MGNPNTARVANDVEQVTPEGGADNVPLAMRQIKAANDTRGAAAKVLQKKPEDDFPEEAGVKAAKDKYWQGYLDQHQDALAENLATLIREFKPKSNSELRAKQAVAFEATVDYCIEHGKASAETIMLALIHGIVKGLVRQDHIPYYQKHCYRFPALEFLLSIDLHEIQELARRFKDEKPTFNFHAFYWQDIVTHPRVVKRIQKSATDDQMDHDHAGEFLPGGNAETVKRALTKREGAEKTTMAENMYAGYSEMLRHNRNNREVFRQALKGFLIAHGIAMAKRAYVSGEKGQDKFVRFENVHQIPRISSLFGKPKTLAEIDKDIWAAIGSAERKLFRILKNPNGSFAEVQKYLLKQYQLQVNSWDDFYDKIESVVEKIIPMTRAERRAA
ncbi:MAG: hypothetical protein V1908_03165 [Candidatus Peregrinibacteria bacterium]